METYTANLRIVIKKLITKDVNEALFLKFKLLENKKYRKIYDIIVDKNILCIYIAPEENINDLLSVNISKEDITEGHCKPIDKNEISELLKNEESMCKIKFNKIINHEIKNGLATGFFLEMNISRIPFNKCLISNNHALNEDFFKMNKEIKIEYINEIKNIQIGKRKFYTSPKLDYTCIEIYDSDNIKNFFHINPQTLINNINIYKNQDIFILQYPNGKNLSFSVGKILYIYNNYNFIHNCSTMKGSSGSPIILRYDSSIIGLHYGSFTENENNKENSYNISTSIISIINDIIKNISNNQVINKDNIFKIKNNHLNHNINIINNNKNHEKEWNNFIIAQFSIDDKDVYQDIKIINSYEQYKRENPKEIFDKNMENEKELLENCKIEINGKIIPFSYYYQFKEKNLTIKYIYLEKI